MQKQKRTFTLYHYLIASFCWICLISLSVVWNFSKIEENIYQLALREAKTNYEKDLLYRRWAAIVGGVYVPTSKAPQNPYLNVPLRDIESKDGMKLTLVNPAYMTRMVHELEQKNNMVIGHLTSLNPINPANTPDVWEAKALKLFEKGVKQFHSIEKDSNKVSFRFIAPFVTEEPCLKCHRQQGYKLGDVRGGISISLPYSNYLLQSNLEKDDSLQVHLMVAFIGLVVLFVTYKKTSYYKVKLDIEETNYRLLSEMSPDAIIVHQADKILFANDAAAKILKLDNTSYLLGKSVMSYLHPDSIESVAERITRLMKEGGSIEAAVHNVICSDGAIKELEIVGTKIQYGEASAILLIARDVSEVRKAFDALRIRDEKLIAIFNALPDIIFTINRDGVFVDYNSSNPQKFLFPPEIFLGKKINELLPVDVAQKVAENIKLLFESGQTQQFNYGLQVADTLRYYDCWLSKKNNKEAIAIIRDVTQHIDVINQLAQKNVEIEQSRRAILNIVDDLQSEIENRIKVEAALSESKEKYKRLVENSNDILWTLDADGKILEISSSSKTIYGYEPEELIGKNFIDFVPKDQIIIDSNGRIEWGAMADANNRFVHKEGYIVFIKTNSTIIKDENGNTVAITGASKDITKEVIANKNLRENEEKFRSLFEDHSAVELLLNPESGEIVDANKAASEYYGYSIDTLKGMDISRINVLSREEIAEKMNAVQKEGRGNFIFKHRMASGEIRDVENYSSKIVIGGKVFLHSIIHDITDKKKIEYELSKYQEHLEVLVEERTQEIETINEQLIREMELKKEAEKLLQEALSKEKELSNLKSRFISTASHEFRTPLTSVLTSTELIQRYYNKWEKVKLDEHLDRIKRSVEYLTKLMDNVLTVNKAEAGKIVFTPEKIDLNELCLEVIEELHLRTDEVIDFTYEFVGKEKIFTLDYHQAEHILHNLLSNAVKYSPNGGIVNLSVASDLEKIEITIKDQGIGIPQEDIPRLFDPFHRSKNTIDIKGTGLGLSIVKHAVELHNGKIEVNSTEGVGTTFIVTIPI
ncbi:MAG: PAS domain S-box protein [Melioribacteraceae bacterium]